MSELFELEPALAVSTATCGGRRDRARGDERSPLLPEWLAAVIDARAPSIERAHGTPTLRYPTGAAEPPSGHTRPADNPA